MATSSLQIKEKMKYYQAGYYLMKINKADYGSIKNRGLITASGCINDSYFDRWSFRWAIDGKEKSKISKEIGLMGFYNRNYAQLANPSLTTIGFDHELMGITVAKKLYEIISGNKSESALIPVTIIKRESVSELQRMLTEV